MSTSSIPARLIPTLARVKGLTIDRGPRPATVRVRFGGGKPVCFEVKNVAVLSRERAIEFIRQSQRDPRKGPCAGRLLIATRQLAEPMRETLREAGISWVEQLSGSYRLTGPGLLIDVSGKTDGHHQPKDAVRARLRDKSGLLAEILLELQPNERFSLVEIARRAGISPALSSRILQRLTHLRVIQKTGAGPTGYWQVADPGALLDLWTAEERSRPASSRGLYVWSRSPVELYQKLSQLNETSEVWALGGTGAANLYAPTLTTYPDPIVWVTQSASIERAAQTLGGEIVDKGANIQIWQSEGDIPLRHSIEWKAALAAGSGNRRLIGLRLISRPRAYLEAMAGTGRSAEVAGKVREAVVSGNTSQ